MKINFIKNKILAVSFAIAIFGAGVLFVDFAQAQSSDNLVVKYWSETQSSWLPLQGPIFDETNFLPGQSVIRLIKVTNTNNSAQSQRIATEAINYPNPIPAGDLSRALMLVIKEGAIDLYGGSSLTGPKTLFDFYQDSKNYQEISLSDLANGATTQYDFVISFPPEEENQWQGATTTFDILVGFQQGETGVLPPSPPASSGGGGLPPGLTIPEESVVITTTTQISATITWTTSYQSTSQVIYATEFGNHTLDLSDTSNAPPEYGYEFTTPEYDTTLKVISHVVVVSSLTSGTKYYFRPVSHGSLAIAKEYSFTTQKAGENNNITENTASNQEQGEGSLSMISGSGAGVGALLLRPEGGQVAGTSSEVSTGQENLQEKPPAESPQQAGNRLQNAFLASIGLFPADWAVLIVLVLIAIVFIILTNRKKKKKKQNQASTNPIH